MSFEESEYHRGNNIWKAQTLDNVGQIADGYHRL